MAAPLLQFFTAMENQGGIIVKETPKLDLEQYIQNYKGRTRFDHLFLIGRSSVPLCVDALKAAVAEAKRGRDTQRYRDVVECLQMAAPHEPDAAFDRAWLDHTEKSNKAETHRLEAELKGYKNNLIKESIRMGNEDLGKHLENIGDLNGAAEAYARMRPDISTPKQHVDVQKHLIRVALQRREWGMVDASANKMALNENPEDEKALQSYVKIARGISLLGQERFQEAALSLLQADASIPSTGYSDIASPNDVAVYGGLLALASMDRKDLQTKVLENSAFRTFLELEPHIRRALTQFVNGRYSACIAILESYRADYLLDIYLQRHIANIYSRIRCKCIVQYMIPFSCVTFESLEANFAVPGESLEEELVKMIRDGALNARINSIDKLVVMVSTDPRAKMQATALEVAREYEKEVVDRIRRMGIAAADLEVKGPRKPAAHTPLSNTDMVFDDPGLV